MNLNIYEIVLIGLMFLGLGYALANHGKIEQNEINFWTRLISSIITFWLLYQAGLFH